MDTVTLVNDMIGDGQKVVERLVRDGFEVTTAFWLKDAENGQWYFYVASPVVEQERLPRGYSRLHTIIRRMPQTHCIDPLEVKLVGRDEPITKDVLAVHQRSPGPAVCPIRWGGTRLGNVSVEGAYLYPLTITSASP